MKYIVVMQFLDEHGRPGPEEYIEESFGLEYFADAKLTVKELVLDDLDDCRTAILRWEGDMILHVERPAVDPGQRSKIYRIVTVS